MNMYIEVTSDGTKKSLKLISDSPSQDWTLANRQAVWQSQAYPTKFLCTQLSELISRPSHQLHHNSIVKAISFLHEHNNTVRRAGHSTNRLKKMRNTTYQLFPF
jgi:protoheme ferro-lyase